MLQQVTKDTILEHLDELGITEGDRIVVHSSLIAFGLVDVNDIFDCLVTKVGKRGCLVAPTYTFSASESKPYCKKTSPSEVGVLGDVFIEHPECQRTNCPIHNHAGMGEGLYDLFAGSGNVSLGPTSDFEFFYKNNFKLILLGTSFGDAATYLHHVEACQEVPYREWITLKRKIMTSGNEIIDFPCRYFARKDNNVKENFDIIVEHLTPSLTVANLPFGVSYSVEIPTLHKVAANLLKKNPYALVV